MLELLAHLVITAALLLIASKIVSGFDIEGWGAAFLAAIVLGIINAVIKPIMVVLTIPITVFTFGLFLFVINALMLWLTASIVSGVKIKGFGAALLGSLVLTILNILIAFAFGEVSVSTSSTVITTTFNYPQ